MLELELYTEIFVTMADQHLMWLLVALSTIALNTAVTSSAMPSYLAKEDLDLASCKHLQVSDFVLYVKNTSRGSQNPFRISVDLLGSPVGGAHRQKGL